LNTAGGVPFGFTVAHKTDAGWRCSRDFHHVRSRAFTVNSLTGIFQLTPVVLEAGNFIN
jgi:hypothetical protein